MVKAHEKEIPYPPVVVVLGHVDHGKTTMLDAIRKTDVVKTEHGGITQKIGASSITVPHEGRKRAVTFIDTPGHESFALMRSRGAKAADIGLLVVSSLDGVMPQTKESIALFQKSNLPFIVVFTKSDLPDRAVKKVKQQLLKEGVLLEGLGGDVPFIEVSGKTGYNIQALLELILLVFDMQVATKQKSEKDPLEAVVIESRLDQRVGPRATVVVKSGKLTLRDEVACEGVVGRVRTIVNDQGQHMRDATVGDAVEIFGSPQVLPVGSLLLSIDRSEVQPQSATPPPSEQTPLHAEEYPLSVVLRADTLGSLEAIVHALPQEVHIVSQRTGEATEADVMLAKSTEAFIIVFNLKTRGEVGKLAKTEKVLLKHYEIIYELIDEAKDALAGKELAMEEKVLGIAKVLASFRYEKTSVLGVAVLEGRVAKGDRVRLGRADTVIGQSTIASLRQGKNPTSRVEKGQQAGIILSSPLDFTIGDVLTCLG